MGIFLCCVCDFFLIQKIGIFWSCIIHFHFQNSLIFFLLKFLTSFQFVSFIHAALRIWKNNSFTTEFLELCIAEAFKYRAVGKWIFFYLNLPYCSFFTVFFWENGKSFFIFLSSPDIFSVWYLFFSPIFEKVRLI